MFNPIDSAFRSVLSGILAVLLIYWVFCMGMEMQRKDPARFCFWMQSLSGGLIPCEIDPADL